MTQTASYFCLIQIVNDTNESIGKIMNESRQKILENELKNGPSQWKLKLFLNFNFESFFFFKVKPKGNQVIEFQDEYIKISGIDDMANTLQI